MHQPGDHVVVKARGGRDEQKITLSSVALRRACSGSIPNLHKLHILQLKEPPACQVSSTGFAREIDFA